MRTNDVYLGPSDIGQGIFASRRFSPGEKIFFVTGRLIDFAKVLELDEVTGSNVIQVGADAYVNPGFPGAYINHSCAPNAGIRDDLCVVAIEEILPDAEIRFDYSTCISENCWTMECQCRSRGCRGIVSDFSALPEAVQKRYLELGIVQPFIKREMELQNG